MLNQQEIFSRFPNIKLSYEHITHKKVHTFNYMIAMPSGIKAFAWFSVYKDKRVCYILEKQHIYIVNVMASSQLNYGIGTIFYGTVLTSTSFCIEETKSLGSFPYCKNNSASVCSSAFNRMCSRMCCCRLTAAAGLACNIGEKPCIRCATVCASCC